MATKYTMLPVPSDEQWAYDLYKKAYQSFWIADEVSFFDDRQHFPKLDEDTRYFIKHVLAFFASADGIVNENLALRFYGEFDSPIIRAFYAIQIGIEQIHSQTYSEMIEALVDPLEQDEIFNSIETMPIIKKMGDYIKSIVDSKESLERRLIGMLCVEGILFSGSFCAIYFLKKNGKCPGLAMANELIARDEGLHAQFACELYRAKCQRLPWKEVFTIVGNVVDLAREFAVEALPVALLGMNAEHMTTYIQSVADYWLGHLGYNPMFKAQNPFSWMIMISLENKTNFFERRVSEYSKAQKTGDIKLVQDF